MENKHKIDKLFSDKLKEYEMSPSPEAWKRIELMNAPNKRKVVPLYWAAASVLIIATLGVLSWNKEQNKETASVVVVDHPSIKTIDIEAPLVNREVKQTSEAPLPKLRLPQDEKKKLVAVITTSSTPALPKEVALTDVRNPVKEEFLEESSTFELVRSDEKEQEIAGGEEDNREVAELENNRVLVAEIQVVATAEEENLTKEKRVRKIFKQLKNLKNGEEVNWEEVGVNPKQLIARVDPLKVSSRH